MKKLLLIVTVLICIISCNTKTTSQEGQSDEKTSELNASVYTLDSLLAIADQLIDETVKVRGFVTHTCKHSGKRCFIMGDDEKTTIRVDAQGEIIGFDPELVGSELIMTGVLKERRLSKEYIDQHEKEVNEKKAKEDGSAETCEAELSNIKEMRDWMKANNKEYYSIYYMDGESYDIIED